MAKEYPNWKVRFVDLENTGTLPVAEIFTLPWNSHGNLLAYRDRHWYRQKLVPVNYPASSEGAYRKNGVYIIIGGAGGIGLGVVVTAIYAGVKGWATLVPPEAMLGGFAAALLIGGVAGLQPAIKAANLSPTEALRTT